MPLVVATVVAMISCVWGRQVVVSRVGGGSGVAETTMFAVGTRAGLNFHQPFKSLLSSQPSPLPSHCRTGSLAYSPVGTACLKL